MKQQLTRWSLTLGLVSTLALAPPAKASILDNPFFQVLGLVIVWSGNAGATPQAHDFVLMTTSGSPGPDLIAGDGVTVVTGSLVQGVDPLAGDTSIMDIVTPVTPATYTDVDSNGYMNAGDTLTSFEMDATTDVDLGTAVRHSFYVASNDAFEIHADSSAAAGPFLTTGAFAALTRADVGWTISVDITGTDSGFTYGTGAQDPDGGGGGISGVTDLSGFDPVALAYTATRGTALAVGTILSQSVRFDAEYSLLGYDLSDGTGTVEAHVLYTIYVP